MLHQTVASHQMTVLLQNFADKMCGSHTTMIGPNYAKPYDFYNRDSLGHALPDEIIFAISNHNY